MKPRYEKPCFSHMRKQSNYTIDQRLCFRYIDSAIPLLLPFSVAVQPGLCWTRSKTSNTGFLVSRLIFKSQHDYVLHKHNYISLHRHCVVVPVCLAWPFHNFLQPGAIARSVAMSPGNQEAPQSMLASGTSFREDLVMKLFLRPFFLFC